MTGGERSPDRPPVRLIFEQFNSRYFGSRLPRYRVRRQWAPKYRAWGWCYPHDRLITVHPGLVGDGLKTVLLHEMCHIPEDLRERPAHGPRFRARLESLLLDLPQRLRTLVSESVSEGSGTDLDYFTPEERVIAVMQLVDSSLIPVSSRWQLVQRLIEKLFPPTTRHERRLLARAKRLTERSLREWARNNRSDRRRISALLERLVRDLARARTVAEVKTICDEAKVVQRGARQTPHLFGMLFSVYRVRMEAELKLRYLPQPPPCS